MEKNEQNSNETALSEEKISNTQSIGDNSLNENFEEKGKEEMDIGVIAKYDKEKGMALVIDIKNKFKIGDNLKLKNETEEFEFKITKLTDKNLKKIKSTSKKDNSVWINMPKDPGEIAYLTRKKGRLEEIIEFLRDLIIIFVTVIIIRTYIASPFQISGSSMEKSYHDKEFIIVDKFSYAELTAFKVGDPTRGDVVIFRPHASNGKEYYIKRVIGMPTDIIKFQDGEVYIRRLTDTSFIKLNEDYLDPINKGKTFLSPNVKENTFTIPENEYFLMGDNRNNSSDSRSCFMSCTISGSSHFIKRGDVIGKVFLDFGYFNIFDTTSGTLKIGQLKWIEPIRLLDTTRSWEYKELE